MLFPAPGPTNATDVVLHSFLRKLFRYEILLISILRADGNFIDKNLTFGTIEPLDYNSGIVNM